MILLWTLLSCVALLAVQGIYRNLDVYLGKRKTYDAMPEHLDEQSEIDAAFPDDSQFANRKGLLGVFGRLWKAWKKLAKPWEAFGPLSRFAWARWREIPITLFAIKGEGRWRFERDYNPEQPDAVLEMALNDRKRIAKFPGWYLSRIQYWTRWHLAVNWPLQVTFHMYWRDADVPAFPERNGKMTIKDMVYVYGPTHRDADKIYWILSFVFGGDFK